MTPREIIARAWAITNAEVQLRRWGFAASLLKTLLNVKLLVYQAWFAYSYFVLNEPIGFFMMEEVLLEHLPFALAISIIITLVILVIIELIFPHFAKGAIIGLAAKAYKKEEVRGGLVLGIYNFFPIFAAHEILVLSGVTTVVTIMSLALRYTGNAAPLIIAMTLIIWVFSLVLEFIFVFVEEATVIRKTGLKAAMGNSFKLVISYIGHVVFLTLLMFFIFLRILANMLMVILIPGVVLGMGFALSALMPPVVSYSISTVLGLAIVVAASYFFAYIEVFRQTVWTITYIELSKRKELDVIEVDDEEPKPATEEVQ